MNRTTDKQQPAEQPILTLGWILVFDAHEAWESKLDSNKSFISLHGVMESVEQLFLQQAYDDHVNEMKNYGGEEARCFEDFTELFRSDRYYQLPSKCNTWSLAEVCNFIRLHSFFYPHKFYLDGKTVNASNVPGHLSTSCPMDIDSEE